MASRSSKNSRHGDACRARAKTWWTVFSDSPSHFESSVAASAVIRLRPGRRRDGARHQALAGAARAGQQDAARRADAGRLEQVRPLAG